MTWRQYYWEWLWRAFKRPLAIGQAVAFLLTLVGGYTMRLRPELGGQLNYLLWAIPLAVFLAILAAGFALAPYHIHSELERERDDLRAALDDRLGQAEAERWRPAVDAASERLMHAEAAGGREDATYVLLGAIIRRAVGPVGDWTNKERKALVAAIGRTLQTADDLQWLPRSGTVMVVRPEDVKLPPSRARIHIEFNAVGFAMLRIGWKANPFPLAALLYGLHVGFGMITHPELLGIWKPALPMDVTLGLVNWPEKGIDLGPLLGAAALEHGTVSRSTQRIVRRYRLAVGEDWQPIAAQFVDVVLGEAG